MVKKYLLCLLFLAASCTSLKYEKYPKEEFRGVWVATVVNIDWPKNGNDAVAKQKEDFLRILDFYDDLNFNAMIVQVRTAGDALYPTEKAPWSRFLTGKEGRQKSGFEDPLRWMLDKTHERGMQFHVWFNPYRATFDLDTTILDTTEHDFYSHRDWMVKYGKKYYYNPGNPEVWEHLTDVVGEVVEKYDVDGVHFDDYFYPYKIQGEIFNDSLEYKAHALPQQSLGDWRRSNVDSLVKNVHQVIEKKKPWVEFGISPFGVWKNNSTDPKGSDTKAGQTTYEDLYADPLLWMEKGWIDYIVPQAYWSMHYPAASHEKIARWWATHSGSTALYMGNGPYKIRNNADEEWNDRKELPKQLALARNIPQVSGNVFFSAKSLMGQHQDVVDFLKKRMYRRPALLPSSIATKKTQLPALASITKKDRALQLCISHFDTIPRFISIYGLRNPFDTDKKELLKRGYIRTNEAESCIFIENLKKFKKKYLGIAVQDAFGNTSELTVIDLKEVL